MRTLKTEQNVLAGKKVKKFDADFQKWFHIFMKENGGILDELANH